MVQARLLFFWRSHPCEVQDRDGGGVGGPGFWYLSNATGVSSVCGLLMQN